MPPKKEEPVKKVILGRPGNNVSDTEATRTKAATRGFLSEKWQKEALLLTLPSHLTPQVKMGVVGLPNVGKSTFFNLLCGMNVAAENFPFCTIDPNISRVAVPDERFDYLVETYKPKSIVPAVLTVTDIAGLVKGAAEGAGLGNAFLSHIAAVDGIFHMVRSFSSEEVIHVEGSVDPTRDLGIIHGELLRKAGDFHNLRGYHNLRGCHLCM
jgi:obg-like ATPase 1